MSHDGPINVNDHDYNNMPDKVFDTGLHVDNGDDGDNTRIGHTGCRVGCGDGVTCCANISDGDITGTGTVDIDTGTGTADIDTGTGTGTVGIDTEGEDQDEDEETTDEQSSWEDNMSSHVSEDDYIIVFSESDDASDGSDGSDGSDDSSDGGEDGDRDRNRDGGSDHEHEFASDLINALNSYKTKGQVRDRPVSIHRVAKLDLYLGPMFSQKTTRLITELTCLSDIGANVAYINHRSDIRDSRDGVYQVSAVAGNPPYQSTSEDDSESILTTHGSTIRALSNKIKTYKVDRLSQVPHVRDFDVIGIDEGQFFEDIYEMVKLWVDKYGIHVVVSGLDGDAFRQPFGDIYKLIPLADSYVKLTAYCSQCREFHGSMVNAPFTARISNQTVKIVIGGSDIYVPLCREHYNKHNL